MRSSRARLCYDALAQRMFSLGCVTRNQLAPVAHGSRGFLIEWVYGGRRVGRRSCGDEISRAIMDDITIFMPSDVPPKRVSGSSVAAPLLLPRRPTAPAIPSKKNCTGVSNKRESSWSLPAEMRFVPFSYFCTCWNVRPRVFRYFGLALAGLKPSGAHAGADVLIDDGEGLSGCTSWRRRGLASRRPSFFWRFRVGARSSGVPDDLRPTSAAGSGAWSQIT